MCTNLVHSNGAAAKTSSRSCSASQQQRDKNRQAAAHRKATHPPPPRVGAGWVAEYGVRKALAPVLRLRPSKQVQCESLARTRFVCMSKRCSGIKSAASCENVRVLLFGKETPLSTNSAALDA